MWFPINRLLISILLTDLLRVFFWLAECLEAVDLAVSLLFWETRRTTEVLFLLLWDLRSDAAVLLRFLSSEPEFEPYLWTVEVKLALFVVWQNKGPYPFLKCLIDDWSLVLFRAELGILGISFLVSEFSRLLFMWAKFLIEGTYYKFSLEKELLSLAL